MKYGDYHNFSRRVTVQDKNVLKPRPIWGEWLFLDAESPLHQLLINEIILSDEILIKSKFKEIPELLATINESSVPYIERPLALTSLNYQECSLIGTAIAIYMFLGIGDLHHENLYIGFDEQKRFIFCPIDIEIIFEHYYLVSQSLLLPSKHLESRYSGLSSIFPLINNEKQVLSILNSYGEAMNRLWDKRNKFSALIYDINGQTFPSRVILKNSQTYWDYINKTPELDASFISEELEQLERNDIPYFFRHVDSFDIYYWKSEENYGIVKSKINDIKLSQQILPFDSSFFNNIDKHQKQLKYGMSQIAKTFSKQLSIKQKCELGSVKIVNTNNKIFLNFQDFLWEIK